MFNKLLCKLFGHRWYFHEQLSMDYYTGRIHEGGYFKCQRCKAEREDYPRRHYPQWIIGEVKFWLYMRGLYRPD